MVWDYQAISKCMTNSSKRYLSLQILKFYLAIIDFTNLMYALEIIYRAGQNYRRISLHFIRFSLKSFNASIRKCSYTS